MKDADALLRQPNIERIMSELRDFYDKDSSVRYGNRQHFSYQNIRCTFIMLVTQVLRRSDQSFLGERTLTIEMDVSPTDKEAISRMMMQRSLSVALGERDNPEEKIMSSMKGWINHLRDRKIDSTIPVEFQEMVFRLCSLTALLRTQVDRDFRGNLQSPAMPELPTRLIGQCITAALSLCAVFGENKPTEEIYRILKKVLKDTVNPRSHRFLLCDIMIDNPGITANTLLEASRLDKNVVGNEIRDLVELNFVKVAKVEGGSPGYKVNGYTLRDEIALPFKEMAG